MIPFKMPYISYAVFDYRGYLYLRCEFSVMVGGLIFTQWVKLLTKTDGTLSTAVSMADSLFMERYYKKSLSKECVQKERELTPDEELLLNQLKTLRTADLHIERLESEAKECTTKLEVAITCLEGIRRTRKNILSEITQLFNITQKSKEE